MNVEDAANELINMLCVTDDVMTQENDDDVDATGASGEPEVEKASARHTSATPSGRKSGFLFLIFFGFFHTGISQVSAPAVKATCTCSIA